MMKTNYLTAVALGLLTALCGCQAEDDAPHTPQGTIPIGFSGDVSATRAAGYGSEADLAAIGVFTCFTNGAFSESSSTPNFMYNQKVERQADGSWIYAPVKYWPANATEKLSFFAYAPYVDETVSGGSNPTLSGNTAKGFPTLAYTVPAAESSQVDLLASVPLMNQTYDGTSGSVRFTMKHALTKVTLKVKNGDKYAKEITALSIHAATTGELHFKDGGFEWKNITGDADYAPSTDTDLTFAATDKGKDVATFYLLPTGAVTATYSLSYKVKTPDGTEMLTKTITSAALPSTTSWQPGTSVSYTFNLYEESATVTTETINGWTAGAAETSYTTFSASDLKVGDYYYSDGTTSDGGLRAASTSKDANTGIQDGNMIISDYYTYDNVSPVSGKTCIGIVFYVGQGKGDDVANYSSFGMTRIDGYVVALTDAGMDTWGSGNIPGVENVAISQTTKFDGYANTIAAKAVGGHGIFTKASNYSTAMPATLCSTWYLPSMAQLKTIYSTHGAISSTIDPTKYPRKLVCTNIIKAGGAGLIANRYWSSTPSSSSNAYYLGFHMADMSGVSKGSTNRSRTILTFQQTD